jgi:hypothetical protein
MLLDPARNPRGATVLDPFCGTATVGTAAFARGWPFVGIEAHPEIAELGNLKLQPLPRAPAELVVLAEEAAAATDWDVLRDEPELLRRCFSEDVLASLLALREGVWGAPDWSQPYLKWALLGTLRDVASVKVGWPYLRPELQRRPQYSDAGARFRTRVQWMADDLALRTTSAAGRVIAGSSTDSDAWQDVSGSLCVTSPPYLNNFDYADATRLEMFFWGRNTSWAQMCADVRADMLIATTQQASVAKAKDAMEALAQWPRLEARVGILVRELTAARGAGRRSKEYDRVLPPYVAGLLSVLEHLKASLATGAWCGWVVGDSAPYGVYIDTPDLILDCAEAVGFVRDESVLLRPRGQRWRTNGTRHQVSLEERLVWFRVP